MFGVYIRGNYWGNFSTATEALQCVENSARPFGASWEIRDQFGKTHAKG